MHFCRHNLLESMGSVKEKSTNNCAHHTAHNQWYTNASHIDFVSRIVDQNYLWCDNIFQSIVFLFIISVYLRNFENSLDLKMSIWQKIHRPSCRMKSWVRHSLCWSIIVWGTAASHLSHGYSWRLLGPSMETLLVRLEKLRTKYRKLCSASLSLKNDNEADTYI